MLNSEKSQKIFLFFYTHIPSSFTAVSGQFQQQFQQGSFKTETVSIKVFCKSFLENYFIFIYQSRTSIHSSSPLTTLA